MIENWMEDPSERSDMHYNIMRMDYLNGQHRLAAVYFIVLVRQFDRQTGRQEGRVAGGRARCREIEKTIRFGSRETGRLTGRETSREEERQRQRRNKTGIGMGHTPCVCAGCKPLTS